MYNYHKLDYSKNKSMYMYSQCNVKNFLKKFFLSRTIKYQKHTIEYHSRRIAKYKKILLLLLSFETKKSFFFNDNELSLNDYVEISYYASVKIKKKIDLIYFNSLLKLNDYILFLLKKTNKDINDKINVIFFQEKEIINKVCKIIKINEKIKI